jgi:hypothetical protein
LNITPAQHKAAGELVDLVASRIGQNRAIHPETAISASARLAGTFLLRSFNLRLDDAEAGTVVLSKEANEKGPMLVNTLAAYLSFSGIQLDQEKLGSEQAQRGEVPRLDVLQALFLLQNEAVNVGESNGLSLEELSRSAALATGFIVKECAADIGPEIGFNVAVYGFIEGSKTVPATFGQRCAHAGAKKALVQILVSPQGHAREVRRGTRRMEGVGPGTGRKVTVEFDEQLVERVRNQIKGQPGLAEKKMFGGIAFLVYGNMGLGIHKKELIVRLAPEEAEAALKEPGTRIFDITGRPMKAWLLVGGAGIEETQSLSGWVRRGISYAASLPKKAK